MKYSLAAGIAILLAAFGHAVTTAQEGDGPRFTAANELIRPADFREWVFLTSGLGMTYSEPTGTPRTPNFTNVYVNPSSYRSFMKTGRWPDKTMFILEIRRSTSEGSINKGGHFQSNLAMIEASVKDETRYPGKWAYFDFGPAGPAGAPGNDLKDRVEALPTTARCYACHSEHGAVDNTFVQFYPTLLEVANQKGLERGIAHEVTGQDELAIQEFSAAIKLDPKSAVGFERRATAWFRLGKFDRAGSDYAAAIFLDSKNAAALYGRGMTQRLDRFNPAGTADADVAAARAIKPDITEEMARRGVK